MEQTTERRWHEVWRELCEAAESIRLRHGVGSTFDYAVGEGRFGLRPVQRWGQAAHARHREAAYRHDRRLSAVHLCRQCRRDRGLRHRHRACALRRARCRMRDRAGGMGAADPGNCAPAASMRSPPACRSPRSGGNL